MKDTIYSNSDIFSDDDFFSDLENKLMDIKVKGFIPVIDEFVERLDKAGLPADYLSLLVKDCCNNYLNKLSAAKTEESSEETAAAE
ncbi:hypothetical protein IFO70_22165 [Phormidium tenue FACHB-886]|nr:hypothetical protein [Phormidium tenue FACHB-886]